MRARGWRLLVLAFVLAHAAPSALAQGPGWQQLFDGKSLAGWKKVGGGEPGFVVKDGLLVCPANGGYGELYTEREFGDFVFRFEFRCDKGGNSGVSIRATGEGGGSYVGGQEIQILDDYDPMYANLEPGQYCCGVYKFIPPERGVVRHAGAWNQEEITLVGRQIRIKLNGQVVVDADLNQITDPAIFRDHPAIWRDRGRLGFLGHEPATVSFRNVWVKELSKPVKDNVPPPGFTALFDGKTLKGWQAVVADPPTLYAMAPEDLASAVRKATTEARKHWAVKDGCLAYDGKQGGLGTVLDYGDFEMLVDWRIEPGGESGIDLRGMPQVQICDNPIGSGGLHNNVTNPNIPSEKADNPPGQWNRFRILMVGDRATVFVNNRLVVNSVKPDNYWNTQQPIAATGPIQLRNGGTKVWFKNVFVREIGAK